MRASAPRRATIAIHGFIRGRLSVFTGCFSAIAALLLPNPIAAADWPQFLGPNRNGSTTESLPATNWPKDGPPILWQRKVGEGFCGPVERGGKLILFHRLGDQEMVECLDAASGKELWKAAYPTAYRDDFGFDNGPRATPAIAGDSVFTFGADGLLACWNLGNGTRTWSVDTKARFQAGKGFFGPACSPLVESNAVVLNVGGRDGAGIVAFDTITGKERWRATADEASYASPVAATFDGKRRALVITREAFAALDPVDGRVVFRLDWRPPMNASVSAATPLAIGDLIFISASYGTGATLFRYRETGPEKLWSNDDALSSHYATPVHHDGFLYGFHGRADPGLQAESAFRCVELKTGKVRWSEESLKAGTVTLVNDQLLILTDKGELLRAPATPAGFQESGRAQILPLLARAHPVVAEGRFFARSKDKLVCVDLRARP